MHYFQQVTQTNWEKKIRVLITGVEPVTFLLLIRILYALVGAKALKLSIPVSLTGKIHLSVRPSN